jgi:hypothetical protein
VISAAVITAVSWVLLTKVVCRFDPFHRTVAVLSKSPKSLPFTVSVNCGPPAEVELGERLDMTGAASRFTGLKATAQPMNSHIDKRAQTCLERIENGFLRIFFIAGEHRKLAFPE